MSAHASRDDKAPKKYKVSHADDIDDVFEGFSDPPPEQPAELTKTQKRKARAERTAARYAQNGSKKPTRDSETAGAKTYNNNVINRNQQESYNGQESDFNPPEPRNESDDEQESDLNTPAGAAKRPCSDLGYGTKGTQSRQP
jgi:hypothetical protein